MKGKKCIVRTYSAGVYFGTVNSIDGKTCIMNNARILRNWYGAIDTLEIAKEGVKYPEKCKFTSIVDEITLTEAIAIIPCSDKAISIIESVIEFKAD